MKHTIKVALIAVIIMLCGITTNAQESVQVETAQSMGGNPYTNQSILTLKNNTSNPIAVSFVYFDPIDECWISRGWRHIAPYSSQTINFGVYTGNVYVHAQHTDWAQNLSWGSGHWFCVERGDASGFRIKHPEQTGGCELKREYSRVELVAGTYKEYDFNP